MIFNKNYVDVGSNQTINIDYRGRGGDNDYLALTIDSPRHDGQKLVLVGEWEITHLIEALNRFKEAKSP